ncbi:hypothetical protein F383_03849 [Gossypium arboreum]|uniref:Uncharacterized protein n=1 Tax=Gossypium arboreum TaxID=29729 RepID=A0A0B0PER9_GOSAR|nr:hypothetical protein F383_03849 [Gossypium arboreum]
MLYGRVSARVPFKLRPVYPTVLTRLRHTSMSIGRTKPVYPTVLTRLRHTSMSIGRTKYTGWHMGVSSAV